MKFLCLLLCTGSALAEIVPEGIVSIQLQSVSVTNFQSKVGHESLSRLNLGNVDFGGKEGKTQTFTMMIDTGSSDLWVGSSRCEGSTCPLQKNLYHYNKSKTYQQGNPSDTTELRYGSGSMKIRYSRETVYVGDLRVDKQDFGEALAVNRDIIRAGIEGIMGMAFKPLAHNGKTPIFDTMINKKLVDNPIFTFCKSRGATMKDELIIGGTNTSRYDAAQMVYVPLIQAVYWKFRLDSIIIKNNPACAGGCDAVVDSGTTLVRGPKEEIAKLNSLIGATEYQNGQYQVTCDKSRLPNVDFVIGGKKFTLTPRDYVLYIGDDMCITGFAVSSITTDFLILGGTFLDGLCTIYDKGNLRLGFVKLLR